MKVKSMKLTDIVPYENNPRINDGAVDYVANSIKRFGFKVPIVIDKDNIIVTGHTRYKAAEKLGMKEVPVVVADDLSEKEIKAFRIADNKTSEKSAWDFNKLTSELTDLELDFDFTDFGFGEYELDVLKHDNNFDETALDGLFEDAPEKEKEPKKVQCPHCGEWFEV